MLAPPVRPLEGVRQVGLDSIGDVVEVPRAYPQEDRNYDMEARLHGLSDSGSGPLRPDL